MTTPVASTNQPDVVLAGAGIMSATLAVILKELGPRLNIEIHEVLGSEAQESSNAWNNAGTGHAALCELNYTPEKSDGSIDISKALQVNTEFDLDLSPKLRQPIKSQNTLNGNFDSWEFQDERLRAR
jgi:malate dehydrogenase (quinone)